MKRKIRLQGKLLIALAVVLALQVQVLVYLH